MTEILLVTINARYIHAAFGLRYLMANLGELQSRARILEFETKQRALEIATEILSHSPRIVGMGVYIWNATLSAEVVSILKRVRPELTLILGGPEVSFETELQPVVQEADYVITGEADLKFAQVCRSLLAGEPPPAKILHSELPKLENIQLPYDLYTKEDLSQRILYVEASRGCPFTCEFCLSSLDVPVRTVQLQRFLNSLQTLLQRGARIFKFVDRTFNLSMTTSRAILEFFLEHWKEGLFLHFEMVPDRMPQTLLDLLSRFPKGAVQLEVGIQTFDEATSKAISRRQNYEKLEYNLRYLRTHTGVHIHADLIVGLPSETFESFSKGFDRLLALNPHEIQIGILKRLRGTPITRHDAEFKIVYSPNPPYEILQNRDFDFQTLQRLRQFARFWDLFANSGRFLETLPCLWKKSDSPFAAFLQFSDWIGARMGRNHSLALVSLAEALFDYLTRELQDADSVDCLRRDWNRGGKKRERLPFLEDSLPSNTPLPASPSSQSSHSNAKRQARHWTS